MKAINRRKKNVPLSHPKFARLSGSPRTKGRAWRRRTTWAPRKYFPLLRLPPPPLSSHCAVCKQETRGHPQSAALLPEPRFARRCKIETALGVGGFPCHPQGDPRSLLKPLIDKPGKASEAAELLGSAGTGFRHGKRGMEHVRSQPCN